MTCLQVGDHVAPGGYGSKYLVSMFNRWVDGPLDEPLENTRRFGISAGHLSIVIRCSYI